MNPISRKELEEHDETQFKNKDGSSASVADVAAGQRVVVDMRGRVTSELPAR